MHHTRPAALLAALALALAGAACRAEDEKPRELKTRELKRRDGSVYLTQSFYLGPDGKEIKHGPVVFWYEDGRRQSELHYRDGKLHGRHTRWYPDGEKQMEGEWVNGQEQGVWTRWHEDGEKAWQCAYVDGKIRGKETWWVRHKKTREDTYDEDGTLVDHTAWRVETWTKLSHGTYKNGVKHGRWTYWDADGKIGAEGEWRDGKPWEGTCGVPALGDAGSWGGIEVFGLYHEGKLVKKIGGSP